MPLHCPALVQQCLSCDRAFVVSPTDRHNAQGRNLIWLMLKLASTLWQILVPNTASLPAARTSMAARLTAMAPAACRGRDETL